MDLIAFVSHMSHTSSSTKCWSRMLLWLVSIIEMECHSHSLMKHNEGEGKEEEIKGKRRHNLHVNE